MGDRTKRRLFAMMFDIAPLGLFCLFVAAKFPGDIPSAGRFAILVITFLLWYFVPEGVWGATLGKRVFGLTVVRLDGSQAGWRESCWRTILRLVEVNPVLLGVIPGGLVVTYSKRGQRLGDMIAHALVVRRDALATWKNARA
jgi:uncharacterized RDD family membrane protein YckC